jgi:hypothetical protein
MTDPNDKLALLKEADDLRQRIAAAVDLIERCGWIEGEHHRQWLLDQVLRALLAEGYDAWVAAYNAPDADGEAGLPWEVGIPP